MCSQFQPSSRIALIIGAWMPGLETTTTVPLPRLPMWNIFKHLEWEINQPRLTQEVLLFLSTNPNFWVRKSGADSLVNVTFENVRSLPSTRVNRGARQVNPRRLGILSYITTLRKTFGCAILRSCLRVSPTTMRIRRSSPNIAGGCAAVLSSPPPGAVKAPTNQVSCIVPYNFPRMSIRLRSSRCGTHHNCRDQACASLLVARTCQSSLAFPPELMLEAPRKSSHQSQCSKAQERLQED